MSRHHRRGIGPDTHKSNARQIQQPCEGHQTEARAKDNTDVDQSQGMNPKKLVAKNKGKKKWRNDGNQLQNMGSR